MLPEEGKSENVKGAVELIAQWWYNPALDFEPFLEPDDHADAPPNELRVAIVAARDLAIKDKNLLLRCLGASSVCSRLAAMAFAIYTSSTPSTRRLTGSFAHRSKGGSSDPRCTLTVSGTELKAQSSTNRRRSSRGGARCSASSTRRGPTLRTRRSWTCSSRI